MSFKTTPANLVFSLFILAWLTTATQAQTLINIDFGAGTASNKKGFAATGQGTNDFWNSYHHYEPKFLPGMPQVANGKLTDLKYADGTPSRVAATVTNAPGVWGNATGDPMLDSYIFAPNGSNIVLSISGLESGRYQFYFYGYAATDVSPEQSPSFTLHSGTNDFGPVTASGAAGWAAGQLWREHVQYIAFRDVPVASGEPLTIDVAPGAGGIAVLNGLQILSRGTSPPRLTVSERSPTSVEATNIVIHEIRYDGRLESNQVRLNVTVQPSSRATNETSALLFEGDLALVSPKLPAGWWIANEGKRFILHSTTLGTPHLEFELIPKAEHAEPWDQISISGPWAAIATASIQTSETGVELQFLNGTPIENKENTRQRFQAALDSDRKLAFRWQKKTAEIAREPVVISDTKVSTHITPNAIRYTTELHLQVLQSRLEELKIEIPLDHTILQVQNETMRDWKTETVGGRSFLKIHFLRPLENMTTVTLVSEQTLGALPTAVDLKFPGIQGLQRENGTVSLMVEDIVVRTENVSGLRQVNASQKELAAYRFNSRPISLRLQLSRVEPKIAVTANIRTRLDEGRLLVRHELDLNVTEAGIYTAELMPQAGFVISDVHGEDLDDWKLSDSRLSISFKHRVLGPRKIAVQLERVLTNTPPQVAILPLRVKNASSEAGFIGAGSAPGIQLKTATLNGAHEVPIHSLPDRKDELLAFRIDKGEWSLVLSTERLPSRAVAEVFNLVTIGDGQVGGSAIIRFGIANQGLQQFRIRLPKHWRNVEFTGPNIRRRDQANDVWTVALQDKAWAGYTLVVTYDYAFNTQKATLDLAGAHPLDVERETGAVAVTSAASAVIEPGPITEPLRQIDPTELSDTDRSLISRPVLLAYHYEGTHFALNLSLTRHDELTMLDAVSDRVQLTTVITENSEMLTQASFMVKNNERQFQRFKLPANAVLWGVTVNNEPVKADRDGDWLLVSLPRGADRDQLFAVDLKYAQKLSAFNRLLPGRLGLEAPQTDIPGTYAEWELYVPPSKRVSGFGGNMTIARGTTYGLRDGWQEFIRVYAGLWHEYGAALLFFSGLGAFFVALIAYGRKLGFQGIVGVVAFFCIVGILASMLLPALSKAKSKAQRIKSVNNLKNIGMAARIFAGDHEGRMPASFDEMMAEISTDKVLFDPETGERYTYVGAGKTENDPNAVLAYSPSKSGRREVLLTDGSVQMLDEGKFGELLAKQAGNPVRSLPNQPARPGLPPLAQRLEEKDKFGITPRPPAAAPMSAGGIGGGGGAVPAKPAELPMTTGVKSLRIEIPRTGRSFHFTRVLNLSSEPASIQFSVMSAKAFVAWRTIYQVTAFLVGLLIVALQWRRPHPSAVWLALGASLALLGTADLFIAWRMLHLVLIVCVPAMAGTLLLWLGWRFLKTGSKPTRLSSATAPATAILLLGFLSPMAATAAELKRTNAVSIVSANYRGSAHERVAEFEAALDLTSSKTNQSVPLFGKEVTVQEFTTVSGDAKLWREGERIGVSLPAADASSIRMKLLIRLGGDVARRELDFSPPAALSSQLILSIDELDAGVEFPGAIVLKRFAKDQKTVVESIFGALDRVSLSWTPHQTHGSAPESSAFVQQSAVVSLGNGAVNTRSTLDWRVGQGELRTLRLEMPQGQKLLRVAGELVKTWDFSATNREILTIELSKPVSSHAQVIVETERALEALPARVPVLLPHAQGIKRETGVVALLGSDELGLTIEQSAGLERVENTEFPRTGESDKRPLDSVWRFLSPGFNFVIRAEPLEPKIEAVVRNQFTIGSDQINNSASVDFSIARAGIFSLQLALPQEGRVENIACDAMQNWTEHNEVSGRRLDIALKQRSTGKISVHVEFTRSLTNLPASIDLESIHPLGASKITGYVSAAPEPGIGIKTSAVSGLSEIPAETLPGGKQVLGLLAFKYLASQTLTNTPWKLTLSTEALESWVRAEIANSITVGETHLSGHAIVRYDVQNAPTKEFRLRVPNDWRNVEITGGAIRRYDQATGTNGTVWRIELQSKVRGENRLEVRWEQTRTGTNAVVIHGVEAVGAERETGTLAFYTTGQLQLTPKTASESLLRIDTRELPNWAAGGMSGSPVLSYRYLRPGWELALSIERFQEAALLQALIDQAQFRTVVADDGQFMTLMSLQIRNNGRQNLAITLPSGCKLWSASVEGQPVRPARQDSKLLLSLERTGGHDTPVAMELTYVGTGVFPRNGGHVELVSPRFDAPLKEAHWEVFLPPDYTYDHFKGSMAYESADLIPIAQDFTMAEYQRQEFSKKESFASQAADFLRRAKSEVASGRYDNVGKLTLLRSKTAQDGANARELQELEKDINQAQSSNLIQAQRNYFAQNSSRLQNGATVDLEDEARTKLRYDEKVAELQVERVQKAQAVAVTRITPLRVNLPTRGLRHSFVQVLQTEVDKPLTIRFNASNDRDSGWFRIIVTGVIAFVILWIASFIALLFDPMQRTRDPNKVLKFEMH